MIDPACNTECETIEKRFRPVLQRYLQRKVWECSAAIEKNADACKIYSLLSDNSNNITVSLKVEPLNIALTTEPSTKDRQAPNGPCEVGICYRPVMPYRITALLDTEENMVVTFLPNSAPAVALSLNRSAFVTAKHQVMIKDGLLQTVSSDKQSEALAVASLPLGGCPKKPQSSSRSLLLVK